MLKDCHYLRFWRNHPNWPEKKTCIVMHTILCMVHKCYFRIWFSVKTSDFPITIVCENFILYANNHTAYFVEMSRKRIPIFNKRHYGNFSIIRRSTLLFICFLWRSYKHTHTHTHGLSKSGLQATFKSPEGILDGTFYGILLLY